MTTSVTAVTATSSSTSARIPTILFTRGPSWPHVEKLQAELHELGTETLAFCHGQHVLEPHWRNTARFNLEKTSVLVVTVCASDDSTNQEGRYFKNIAIQMALEKELPVILLVDKSQADMCFVANQGQKPGVTVATDPTTEELRKLIQKQTS